MLNERKLTERELDKRAEAIQGLLSNKRTLVKKYGKDAEKVMYGIATKQAKNKVEGMNKDKIKELIQTALQKEETTSINESKGAKNYFDDLKYYYTKTLPYLDKDEKEEYKQLAKNFFSKLQEGLDEDYKPSLRAYNVIDKESGEIIDNDLPKHMALKLANKKKGWVISPTDSLAEDLDLGHEDNEPHMLKADLYRIGKYAMELYQMMDNLEGQGEVDLPHWWQAKITNAKTGIVGAKHYLDFEINEPKIDGVVDVLNTIEPDDDAVDTDILNVDIDESQLGTDGDTGFTPSLYTPNELGAVSVDKESSSGAFEEGLKNTVAEKLAKKLKEGLPKGFFDKAMDAEDEGKKVAENEKEVNDEQEGIGDGLDESYDTLVNKLKKQGKSKKASKAIAGAVASYKAKGGGKGPTAKQK